MATLLRAALAATAALLMSCSSSSTTGPADGGKEGGKSGSADAPRSCGAEGEPCCNGNGCAGPLTCNLGTCSAAVADASGEGPRPDATSTEGSAPLCTSVGAGCTDTTNCCQPGACYLGACTKYNDGVDGGGPSRVCVGWTVPGDGTATDQATGLTWQLGQDLSLVDGWQDAQTYCSGLTLAGGGWSLPTIVQLKTLLTAIGPGPGEGDQCYIDGCVFDQSPYSCIRAGFWSSSLTGDAGGSAVWTISYFFSDSVTINMQSDPFGLAVMCVR